MKALVSAVLLVFCIVGYSESVRAQEEIQVRPADVYISGFGGYSFPFKTDVSQGGFTASDRELDNSLSIGGKLGVWMTLTRKILGIDIGAEIDVTNFNPDARQGIAKLNATYFGINLLARLPMGVTPELPNGRWFPYLGFGGGGQRLAIEVLGDEGRSTAPAFQGLGGVKVFLTKHFAAFAEGKFIHASHSQEVQGGPQIDLTLSSVHGVGGLSFHF